MCVCVRAHARHVSPAAQEDCFPGVAFGQRFPAPGGGSGGARERCDPRGPSGRHHWHRGSLTSWPHVQVQLTDFENSAYVVFVVLLTRVILSYKLDFLIPLSKVRMVFSVGLAVGVWIIIQCAFLYDTCFSSELT